MGNDARCPTFRRRTDVVDNPARIINQRVKSDAAIINSVHMIQQRDIDFYTRRQQEQETWLSQRDRATLFVNRNIVNCPTTIPPRNRI